MKKYVVLFMFIFLGHHLSSFAQAVDDRAVVPLSVTLNSILRLNIESGGNIEFNFNTLQQYQNGINTSFSNDQYQTRLTIASSVNYDLEMGAEDSRLVSTDTVDAQGGMDLEYIAYQVELDEASSFTAGSGGDLSLSAAEGSPAVLSQINTGEVNEIVQNEGGNAGDVTDNAFTIQWACGIPTDDFGDSAGSLMGSDLTGGRYSTNVFFILRPAD